MTRQTATVRLLLAVATIGLTGCQPKAEGTRFNPTIENQTDIMLRVSWGDGTVNLDPHSAGRGNFLSKVKCATHVNIIQLVPSQPIDYRPPVKISPDPWCYDQPLVITDV